MDNIDLKLNSGDLGYTNTGDLDITSGIDAIWQSISLRLQTSLGSNLFDSSYGGSIGNFVDEPITDDMKKLITSEANNIISQDERVQSVTNIIVENDNGISLTFGITTSDGNSKTGTVMMGGGV